MTPVLQVFLSLDGVCQVPYLDEEFGRLAGVRLAAADAFLFGRRTYVNFARDWPEMTEHPSGAHSMAGFGSRAVRAGRTRERRSTCD